MGFYYGMALAIPIMVLGREKMHACSLVWACKAEFPTEDLLAEIYG